MGMMDSATTRYEDSVLVVRLPPNLKAALRHKAAADKTSMNTYVIGALGEKLDVPVTTPAYVVGSGNGDDAA